MATYTLTCTTKAIGLTAVAAYLGRILIAETKAIGFNGYLGAAGFGVFAPMPRIGTRLCIRQADGAYRVVMP